MTQKETKFKKGYVYKALKSLTRLDRDWMGNDDDLFTKNKVYPCYKDDTLYSMDGTHHNELIPEENSNDFKLIGICSVKMENCDIRKEAMRVAFEELKIVNKFEDYYEIYSAEFDKIYKENEDIDNKHFIYLDGTTDSFWAKNGSLNYSKV